MNNIPNIDLVREMYDQGWITLDLYINGGTSLDLLLMYQHGIDVIQQNPTIDFDVHCYNNITVSSQIEAYTDLISETEYFVDYFTEPILERYKEQLQILKTLNIILQTKLN